MFVIIWKTISPTHKTSHICLNLSTSGYYTNDIKKSIYIQNFMLASDELSNISILNYWGLRWYFKLILIISEHRLIVVYT